MKMRKKLAALLAASMIASVMPMSVFADSANRVDKVITLKKDSSIKVEDAPELKIKMKDELTTDLSFYLNLTGAEWGSIDNPNFNSDATANTDALEDFAEALSLLGHTNIGVVLNDGSINPIGTSAPTGKTIKAILFTVNNSGRLVEFEAYRENNTTMAIKHVTSNESFLEDDILTFPLIAKVTDSEAVVSVRKHDTEVSNSEHLFAVSDADKAKVVVGDVPNFYRTSTIADITVEELYANSVKDVLLNERWFTLELRDTDFTFEVDGDAKIVGERAYRGYEVNLTDTANSSDLKANYTLSKDRTRLGIRIDSPIASARERGNFVLKGIKVVADRDARNGEVKATIDSKELFGKEIITIANRGDYKTKLDVPKDWEYEVVAGNEKEVEFILSEELANSLTGTRPVTFTFDQGVKIKTNVHASSKDWTQERADAILWGGNTTYLDSLIDAVEAATSTADLAEAQAELYKYLYGYDNARDSRPGEVAINVNKDIIAVKGDDVEDEDKGDWDAQLRRVHIARDRESFTVDNFNVKKDTAGKYTFKTTLLVPASVKGDIKVAVAGSGVTEEEIVILKAEAPVDVETTGMDIKVGLKEITTTGKITIKETAKERIAQAKDIVLAIADQNYGLQIKSFKATVVAGDLVLEDRKDTDRRLTVKRVSTEPSTIEITDIVMSTDRTVPEGKYDFLVGGAAISSVTGRMEFAKNDHFEIDPVVVVKDFINITTKNTEDISGSANKAVVGFVVGSDQYLVNGKVETMDAPPYIKDGNTMVPVRYVATALGVDADKVIWDQENKTATILADKVVQVKLGSKAMNVNGVIVPMNVAAELTDIRTFVPMGAIARALDVRVEWDNDTKTATFNPAK